MGTIHIELLNESVGCWRPVQAEKLSEDTYRITEKSPEDEAWAFNLGDVVRCRVEMMAGDHGTQGPVLVAYERVLTDCSPNAHGHGKRGNTRRDEQTEN